MFHASAQPGLLFRLGAKDFRIGAIWLLTCFSHLAVAFVAVSMGCWSHILSEGFAPAFFFFWPSSDDVILPGEHL